MFFDLREVVVKVKFFPVLVIVFGVGTMIVGIFASVYSSSRYDDAKDTLVQQQITLTGDADEIVPGAEPGALVDTADEAEAMAEIINTHAMESTGGKSYAELDRDDPARDTAMTAANLQTSLYTASMGLTVTRFGVIAGYGVVAFGVLLVGVGLSLLGLVSPKLARMVGLRAVVDQ